MLRSDACDCFRQPVFSEGCFLFPGWLYLPHEAARQLSQDDLVLLLRQQPGGALTEDIDRPQAQLFHLRLCQGGAAVPAPALVPPALAPPVVAGAAAAPADVPDLPPAGTFEPQLRAFEAVNFDFSPWLLAGDHAGDDVDVVDASGDDVLEGFMA